MRILKQIDDKRAAVIDDNDYGINLQVMNNGFQWSGATMYSIEIVRAAHEALGEYLESVEGGRDES